MLYTGGGKGGSVWSGGAPSRLDAQLVQVVSGQTVRYDFAVADPLAFKVTPPAGVTAWTLSTHDALTGDLVGRMGTADTLVGSNIGPGAKLLRFEYAAADGTPKTCWMQRVTKLGNAPFGVYFPGPSSAPTPINVRPGINCLPKMPPANRAQLDRFTGQENRKPAATATQGTAASAVSAEDIPTFNDLVQTSFEAAVQLAVGALL